METDLRALLAGQLGGEQGAGGLGAGLGSVQQLWTMLDDMAQSDPEAYQEYMRKQLSEAAAEEATALPLPAFCAYVYVSEPAGREGPLLVNLCAHHSIKPAAAPDAPVNLAVGVLREAVADAELVAATGLRALAAGDAIRCADVITHENYLSRARSDAGYRRELFELVVRCVEDSHPPLRIKATSLKLLNPRTVSYGGGKVARFRDSRAPARPAPCAPAPPAAPALPGVGPGLAEQLASLASGDGRAGGGGSDAGEHLGHGELRLPGAPPSPAADAPAGGVAPVGRPLILELPTCSPAPQPPSEPERGVGAARAAAAAQSEAVAGYAEPAYELQLGARAADGSAALALHVWLPALASARAVQLELSDSVLELRAEEGAERIALRLRLPALVHSARATSRFDKKRRVLSVVAPLRDAQ